MKIITIPMSYYFAVLLLSASGCLSGDIKGQKNNMIITVRVETTQRGDRRKDSGPV